MTTVLTEGKHAGEFIVSEANGGRSREIRTVLSGEDLAAGQVFELDNDGKAKAFSGDVDTEGALLAAAAGIMFDNVDASATGANADVPGQTTVERDAEVNLAELTYPADTTDVGIEALMVASLKAAGIICR